MAGWEFLSGLLSGVGDTYQRASEENRRISLLKKQLDISKANAEAQLAESREARMSRERMENRQIDLQERLGMGELGVKREGLAVRREETAAEQQMRLLMQDRDFQNDIAKTGLGAKYQEHLARIQHALSEQGADRDVGRKITLTKAERDANTAAQKELMGVEQTMKKEMLGLTTAADIDTYKQKTTYDFSHGLLKNALAQGQASVDEAVQLSANALDAATEAEKLRPGDGDRVLAFFKKQGIDIEKARAKNAQIPAKAMQAARILEEEKDPRARAAAIMSLVGGEGADDFSKLGQVGPGSAGKIDLTNKPTGQAAPSGAAIDLTSTTDVYNLIQNYPGLAADLDAEFKANPGLVKQYHRTLPGVGGRAGEERQARINFIKDKLKEAPGDTLDEKIQNMKAGWESIRSKRIGTEIKELLPRTPNGHFETR